jgi:hypothetical protein
MDNLGYSELGVSVSPSGLQGNTGLALDRGCYDSGNGLGGAMRQEPFQR